MAFLFLTKIHVFHQTPHKNNAKSLPCKKNREIRRQIVSAVNSQLKFLFAFLFEFTRNYRPNFWIVAESVKFGMLTESHQLVNIRFLTPPHRLGT